MKFEIVILLIAVANECTKCIQAYTVFVLVLIWTVSQIGSRHSDFKMGIIIVDNFNFAALSDDELLMRKYRFPLPFSIRSDGDNSVLNNCRVAVGSVNCWDELFYIIILNMLWPNNLCFPLPVLLDQRVEFDCSRIYEVISLLSCLFHWVFVTEKVFLLDLFDEEGHISACQRAGCLTMYRR